MTLPLIQVIIRNNEAGIYEKKTCRAHRGKICHNDLSKKDDTCIANLIPHSSSTESLNPIQSSVDNRSNSVEGHTVRCQTYPMSSTFSVNLSDWADSKVLWPKPLGEQIHSFRASLVINVQNRVQACPATEITIPYLVNHRTEYLCTVVQGTNVILLMVSVVKEAPKFYLGAQFRDSLVVPIEAQ